VSEMESFPVSVKRVYDPPAPEDGVRVLVDRLWPRGLSREKAAVDEWMKDIAPSPGLRAWFGHRPERFAAFARDPAPQPRGGAPALAGRPAPSFHAPIIAKPSGPKCDVAHGRTRQWERSDKKRRRLSPRGLSSSKACGFFRGKKGGIGGGPDYE